MSPPQNKDDSAVDESSLRQKLVSVPSHILEKALLLYALVTALDTPAWVRALVLAALAYLINPMDLVPDFALVGMGLSDDLAVLALALERVSRYVTPAVRERAKALVPEWLGKRGGKD